MEDDSATNSQEQLLQLPKRAKLIQQGHYAALAGPDVLMALVFTTLAALPFIPPALVPAFVTRFAGRYTDELVFGLIVEGSFLTLQMSVVDIATRLNVRPPLWVVILIAVGLLVFLPYPLSVLRMAASRDVAVLIPLLISLAERFTVLWTIPTRPRMEKIAVRAIFSNRALTALGGLALIAAISIAGMSFPDQFASVGGGVSSWGFVVAGAIYFAVSAWDDRRVRTAAFAQRPSVLFGFDILHIEYLEPIFDPPKKRRR